MKKVEGNVKIGGGVVWEEKFVVSEAWSQDHLPLWPIQMEVPPPQGGLTEVIKYS